MCVCVCGRGGGPDETSRQPVLQGRETDTVAHDSFSFMFQFNSITLYSLIPHGAVSSLRVVKTERRMFIVFTALTDKR